MELAPLHSRGKDSNEDAHAPTGWRDGTMGRWDDRWGGQRWGEQYLVMLSILETELHSIHILSSISGITLHSQMYLKTQCFGYYFWSRLLHCASPTQWDADSLCYAKEFPNLWGTSQNSSDMDLHDSYLTRGQEIFNMGRDRRTWPVNQRGTSSE